jgi:hypothetical protein
MLRRLVASLILGFVLGTAGLAIAPDLGRMVGPMLCDGAFEPETRRWGLHYRCVDAVDGSVLRVEPERVMLLSVPLLALLLLLPVSALITQVERTSNAAQGAISGDLATAVAARAEILRIARHGNFKRQLLMRVAELRLVLWVQPPQGRPYEAEVAWLVEEECVRQLRVGAFVPVRVNPMRPQRVYPAQPWAHYAPWE